MSILKIARMGHPVLNVRAAEVVDPTSHAVHQLVEDMIETMVDANGAGLAAPQVHVSQRVVVFHAPPDRSEDDEEVAPDDAAVAPLTDERVLGWEGCLSVPGMTGAVPRFTQIRYRGFDLAGQEIVREARDFHARVVQHECDHLDGILYPQRIEDMSLFGFVEEINRSLARAEADRDSGDGADDGDADAAQADLQVMENADGS